jgi:hypothetical protein
MNVVFSRKGFDSGAGRVPSPILPEHRMLSLPIPDKASPIRYEDLLWPGQPAVASLVEQLTNGRVGRNFGAHLDPDIYPGSLPRMKGWRPLFGQTGAAQAHLENHGVGPGDIFLFFGLFQVVGMERSAPRYASSSPRQHVIFGWLQVGATVRVDSCSQEDMPWARYHPHMNRSRDPRNTLYIASENLTLPESGDTGRPGAGVFDLCSDVLRLTAPEVAGASEWLLPGWFAPDGRKPPLTYHSDPLRWKTVKGGVLLSSARRGQEFVLDCRGYPEVHDWLAGLFQNSPATRLPESLALSFAQ